MDPEHLLPDTLGTLAVVAPPLRDADPQSCPSYRTLGLQCEYRHREEVAANPRLNTGNQGVGQGIARNTCDTVNTRTYDTGKHTRTHTYNTGKVKHA